MNIQDAWKETGKAKRAIEYNDTFHHVGGQKERPDGKLRWFSKSGHCHDQEVLIPDLMSTDWQPYHDKKEIKPENAGEYWVNKAGGIVFTYFNKTVGRLTCISKSGDVLINGMSDMEDIIHGQNGWERVYSPDEEEAVGPGESFEVEKIVIDGVKFRSSHGIIFPIADTDVEWDELVNKPPMKIILEIKKEDK